MRAATVIVGAIAVASILIALAFVFSGGSDSQATVTRTVTEEIVRAPEPAEAEPAAGGGEAGGSGPGGLAECEGGQFTVEDVSCEVGAQIREGYEEGGRDELLAEDPGSGETITMSCSGTAPVECRGPGGATVYFGA